MIEDAAQGNGSARAYDAWNEALVSTVYGGAGAGRPVYLDMDDEVIAAAAVTAGVAGSGRDGLLTAVREWLGPVRPERNAFAWARVRTREWRQSARLGTPPFVALLAAFVLAAEDMHADENFSSSNYYERLAQVLGVSRKDKDHLQRDFMKESPTFWRELNGWLESADGERGLPTAYAFDSRRYVSVPISQALVRSADREKLIEFFIEKDLTPGAPVAVDDMVRLLDVWLPTSSASSSLKAMWETGGEARERIAGVVVVELGAWDGSLHDEKATGPRWTRLYVAASESRFPRYGLRFAALLRAAAAPTGEYRLQEGAAPSAIALMASCGGSVSVREAGIDGWLLLDDGGGSCVGSLLAGQLALQHVGSGLRVSRSVKRLVVLQRDDAAGLFVEAEHVQLGRSCLLLVHDTLWRQQEREIERVLREGYVVHPSGSVPGLQEQWTLVSGAEVIDLVDQDLDEKVLFDLASLIPVSWTQLALNGGLLLPGRETWHVDAPPEVVANSLVESEFVVTVEDEGGEDADRYADILGPFTQVGVVPIADLGLPEGDYVIEVLASEKKRDALTRAHLHLRSSRSARPASRGRGDWVGHALEDGQGPAVLLGACRREAVPDGVVLRGALLTGGEEEEEGRPRPDVLPAAFSGVDQGKWPDSLDESDPLVAPAASEPAGPGCLLGGHHFLFPAAGRGAAKRGGRWEATCKNCGRHLVVDRRRRRKVAKVKGGERPRLIVPRSEPREVDVSVLIDALFYLGECTWSRFERLCHRVDEAPFYAWDLARHLSAVGHVDVALGDGLRTESLVVAPTVVLSAVPTEALLTGCLPRPLLEELDEAAAAVGGALSDDRDDLGMPLRRLACHEPGELVEVREAADLAEDALRDGRETALRLLSAAPHVAALREILDERRLSRSGMRRFDFATNRWQPCEDDDLPGAYCARSFTSVYGVRGPDTPPGYFAVADAATVKYLAALDAGVIMLWYAKDEQELVCRLGAPLPPLVERAVVLATGRLPGKHADGTLRYGGVDEELASAVWSRIGAEEEPG